MGAYHCHRCDLTQTMPVCPVCRARLVYGTFLKADENWEEQAREKKDPQRPIDKVIAYRLDRMRAYVGDWELAEELATRRKEPPGQGYEFEVHYIEHITRDLGATAAEIRAMLL